jgi:IS30 family transposase
VGHYCIAGNSLIRQKTSAKYRISSKTIDFIRILIEIDWSPEQVSNVLKNCGVPVSHEWTYQYIHDDKRNKGTLYRHLRQGKKRYRKGQRTKAEVIKNKVSIDERPAIVETKKRFGDWEIDTVLGKNGTGSIVTLLERKTRFYLIKKVDSKSAKDVTQATIELLMPFKDHVHTITADNGREFAYHAEIAEALNTKVYFAHPYSSWERGANENSNGLLRQYVPKGTDLRDVTEERIHFAMRRINYCPKKCLGFKQPAMVFKEMCLVA